MNQQRNNDRFEERLLEHLRSVVAERGAEVNEPVASAPTWRRRALRPALAGAGVAVVAGAGLLVLAGGDDTSSAYAVEPQDDGQVRVEIRSLEDAQGLQAALGEAGVPAEVDYLPAGTACREPRFKPAEAAGGESAQAVEVVPAEKAVPTEEAVPLEEADTKTLPAEEAEPAEEADAKTVPAEEAPAKVAEPTAGASRDAGKAVLDISREAVGPSQTVVLTASPAPDGEGTAVEATVAEGGVAPCVAVPAATVPAEAENGTSTAPAPTEAPVRPAG